MERPHNEEHTSPSAAAPLSRLPSASDRRPLRILCLHGFRQSSKQFAGRTAALRKRLRGLAEFVFVDAPHPLPLLVKVGAPKSLPTAQAPTAVQTRGHGVAPSAELSLIAEPGGEAAAVQQSPAPKRAWLLLPEQHAAMAADSQQRPRAGRQAQQAQQQQPDPAQEAQQHAWMDDGQYLRQTAGWDESWEQLQIILRTQGPFDGVLGFSQGAAVAALMCALGEEASLAEQAQHGATKPSGAASGEREAAAAAPEPNTGGSSYASPPPGSEAQPAAYHYSHQPPGSAGCKSGGQEEQPPLPPPPWFRFAILCSGYLSPLPEHRALLDRCRRRGGIPLPSLHIYGLGGQDRQIGPAKSRKLCECFAPAQATSIEHSMGHLIPASREVVAEIKEFLAPF